MHTSFTHTCMRNGHLHRMCSQAGLHAPTVHMPKVVLPHLASVHIEMLISIHASIVQLKHVCLGGATERGSFEHTRKGAAHTHTHNTQQQTRRQKRNAHTHTHTHAHARARARARGTGKYKHPPRERNKTRAPNNESTPMDATWPKSR